MPKAKSFVEAARYLFIRSELRANWL